MSYTDDPSNPGTAVIVEENNYYPFGLKHKGYNMGGDNSLGNDLAQKWKFGGKELDESLNGILNSYDFGARNYDPELGRWMNIDPLAEKMRRHCPYNYAFDNPILFMDPDGMAPQQATDGYGNVISITSNSSWSVASMNIEYTDSDGNTKLFKMSISDVSNVFKGFNQEGRLNQTKNVVDCQDCPKKINLLNPNTDYLIDGFVLWAIYLQENPDKLIYLSQIVEISTTKGGIPAKKGLSAMGYDTEENQTSGTRNYEGTTVKMYTLKSYLNRDAIDTEVRPINVPKAGLHGSMGYDILILGRTLYGNDHLRPLLTLKIMDESVRNKILNRIYKPDDPYEKTMPDGKTRNFYNKGYGLDRKN